VDRSEAIQQLPALHAVALRLRDEGLDDGIIAIALDIDIDQVPMLHQLAERKLERLMGGPDGVELARTETTDGPFAMTAIPTKGTSS
jgi:hypothetical protein